ncbi:MAG: ABC transporter ATP-binding protein [Chitinophagaceae bacterium]|nr:MAG: ABC transporter ATP-binding protein [Chitinophagaceae bacterium]
MSLLKVTGIQQQERGEPILRDIDFTVEQFQHTAIMGETGSGKTSLVKIIAGWVSPVQGEVFFNGERLLRIPEEKLIEGHKGIAYLNQQSELPGFLRVSQVLEYVNNLSPEEAQEIYDICQINHLLQRRTNQLSGGEKQRIAIARLLTTSPTLLVLDEPFSNLDTINKDILKKLLHDVGERLGITCIMIAHDPQDTLSWAKQLIVLRNGRIIQQGTPESIYYSPVDEYTAGLGGMYNIIEAADSKAFLAQWDYKSQPGRLVIRPEQLLISHDEYDPVFTIRDIIFHGPYSLLVVNNGSFSLRILVGNRQGYKTGKMVRLHLPAGSFHILP